jgi:hypothetical protein
MPSSTPAKARSPRSSFPNRPPRRSNFIAFAEGTKDWIHPKSGPQKGVKLYDGTIFHRVIPQFMIQGGDPIGVGTGGPGYRFEDETKGSPHKFDKPGKLAMANGAEHQRLAVLHHRRQHRLAHRQAHHLRRSGRRPGHCREDIDGRKQQPGQAEQAGSDREPGDRARGLGRPNSPAPPRRHRPRCRGARRATWWPRHFPPGRS